MILAIDKVFQTEEKGFSSNKKKIIDYFFWGTIASIKGGAREICHINLKNGLYLLPLLNQKMFSVFFPIWIVKNIWIDIHIYIFLLCKTL